ncbi:MAG: L,D-transpeptidase family protein [Nitrospirae bacterium]|uniref:L,D-transpeptidase family protein n=1 Tax=Candidatus Magnetobacterium casense TaxID=1455061 RepID=UPI0012DF0D5A|nr:L,D-transpeptidase family protein [Candidatus Magnetobacterium casensis]MBF0337902.1 L,D-transpeptidase family protein [Nitrospirota bacterium]
MGYQKSQGKVQGRQNDNQNGQQELLSGNVFTDSDKAFNVLLVDKSTDNMYIAEVKDNIPEISRKLSVLTGKNVGDKLREGDRKTPEGIYFVTKYIPPEKLDRSLFGEGAYTLNYPNIVDRNKGKTGHGIWIHGRGPNRTDERTKGCVSLQNPDFDSIRPYVEPDTPVVISSTLDFLNPDQYREKRKTYFDIFKGFISSWEKGDFEGYASFFDTNFKGADGLSVKSYLNKKKLLMKSYPDRRVITSEVSIFTQNSTDLMYKFNQLYCASNLLSYGTKKLYLKVDKSKDHRVIAEEFEEADVNSLLTQYVQSMIERWQRSWQTRDIDRYMDFYSHAFYSDSMNYKQWKAHKKGLFKGARSIKVDIGDIHITPLTSRKVQVTFKQRYSSDTVSDNGIKTLILEGCPGEYEIVSESWRAG